MPLDRQSCRRRGRSPLGGAWGLQSRVSAWRLSGQVEGCATSTLLRSILDYLVCQPAACTEKNICAAMSRPHRISYRSSTTGGDFALRKCYRSRRGRMEGVMRARWKLGAALVVSTTLAAGCAETLSLADLPNVTRLPEKLLSKDEQAKTMSGMAEKAQTHQAEAAKEIEKAK